MSEEFRRVRVATTAGVGINVVTGGCGPPVLLLHGFPQSLAMWEGVAEDLARDHTVVAMDLRGYGDSDRPESDETHAAYSFRAMARDAVEVMAELGHERFTVVGHDRGGRVAHRLVRDHPGLVARWVVLDIVPTDHVYATADAALATAYYHWFFLIQPFDLPERLIGADPTYYLRWSLGTLGGGLSAFAPAAMAEYERCFADPATIHAVCEDYRAGASIDLRHDEAETEPVEAPLLLLWGDRGVVGTHYDPLAVWAAYAADLRGWSLPAGHFLAEEHPTEVATAVRDFVRGG